MGVIYTAKTEGRYVYGHPPFGYYKTGTGKNRILEIDEEKAGIIQYVYESFLNNVPFYLIRENIKKRGFFSFPKSIIRKILTNPIYSAQQFVRPWKDHPGGLFPAIHKPIIDVLTWQRVQEKLSGKKRPGITISDSMPLRGILLCHCKKLLTGAPSRNRTGNYYYYYKCKSPQHNNISVIKAHEKLDEALKYMSLSARLMDAVKNKCDEEFEEQNKTNKKLLIKKSNELQDINDKLHSIEEKYIANQIHFDTYKTWFSDLKERKTITKAQIDKLTQDDNELYLLLQSNLDRFTDMQYLYKSLDTVDKQQFLRIVFDSRLYWQNDTYRTPYMTPIFAHNKLILKEKQLIIVEEKKELLMKSSSSGE